MSYGVVSPNHNGRHILADGPMETDRLLSARVGVFPTTQPSLSSCLPAHVCWTDACPPLPLQDGEELHRRVSKSEMAHSAAYPLPPPTYESLDYEEVENTVYRADQASTTTLGSITYASAKWMVCFLIGKPAGTHPRGGGRGATRCGVCMHGGKGRLGAPPHIYFLLELFHHICKRVPGICVCSLKHIGFS